MAPEDSVFAKLASRMGAHDSPCYEKILENQMTTEECQLLLEMGTWTTALKLAEKLGVDESSIQARIDALAAKRFVLRGKDGYAAVPNIRSFPRGPDNARTQELWEEFNRSGEYPRILVAGWEYRLKDRGFHAHKVIPARLALAASPNIPQDQILWYEDMGQILGRAKKRDQRGLGPDGELVPQGCTCRKIWHACDYKGACTGWQFEEGDPGMGMPGTGYRETTVAEGLAYVDDMENQGMVHISPNTSQVTGTCNCCPCCCMVLHSFLEYGNVWETLAPSRYRAVIDQEACSGCQTCMDRCHFDAIEMRKVPDSRKMKAHVVNEHCMGCGLCVIKCEKQAIQLELVRPPEHIPTAPMSAITIVRSGGRADGILYDSLGRPVQV